ncbi:MAG: M14 family zinc carboxypeptidase [Gammaproteobacteria bacterium]
MKTPLEACAYTRYSRSDEIADFLREIAARNGAARVRSLGNSVQGRPIIALDCGTTDRPGAARLKILLVGSHHGGSEVAGGEALLALARDLLQGPLETLRRDLHIVMVPDVNPDGRDLGTSKNANEVNLNRDFIALSQPESQALNAMLRDFSPHAVLDAHESAVLKRKSLAREGYMTDFEAQFECGTHPAIPAKLAEFAARIVLPALLKRVHSSGLPVQRYIREILSTSQAITHGGLTAQCFRNKAALNGALSFLLENRLDPKDGVYPTYHNIASRCAKQLLCLRAFLNVIREHREAIIAVTEASRQLRSGQSLVLGGAYRENPAQARITLQLRKLPAGERVPIEFPDHRHVVPEAPISLPRLYYVTQRQQPIAELLRRQGIDFEVLKQATSLAVVFQRIERNSNDPGSLRIHEWEESREIPRGALSVSTAQPQARLIPLLLDARSASSVVRNAPFGIRSDYVIGYRIDP